MIYLIEGVPGSGKTYWVVNFIKEKYVEYDEVFSNIDGLQLYSENSEVFFSQGLYKDLDRFKDGKKRLLVVDEFQRIVNNPQFHKDNDFYFFFEYHRHLGFDVVLVVQTKLAIPPRLRHLVDVYIVAQSQRFSVPGRFYYLEKDFTTDAVVKRFFLPKKEEVFNLYRSAYAHVSAGKNVLLGKWVLALVLFLGFLVLAWFVLQLFLGNKTKRDNVISRSDRNSLNGTKHNISYYSSSNSSFNSPFYNINQGLGRSFGSNFVVDYPIDMIRQQDFRYVIPNGTIRLSDYDLYKYVGYLEIPYTGQKYILLQNERAYLVFSTPRKESYNEFPVFTSEFHNSSSDALVRHEPMYRPMRERFIFPGPYTSPPALDLGRPGYGAMPSAP